MDLGGEGYFVYVFERRSSSLLLCHTFWGPQIVFCLRGPLAIGQAGNLASPPLAETIHPTTNLSSLSHLIIGKGSKRNCFFVGTTWEASQRPNSVRSLQPSGLRKRDWFSDFG
ncbi:hypothetical protein AVEN_22207-1 [Araneus ventricosus]|uniref:Uncharacterized protein n=1 Tax=Araneus ventricosus TaxID=182803 RepID=A0A4Y2GEI2_ARAVE|nr:hypothetical protein AVEN_22207-1 [Araneus ventricosus]